MAASRKPRKAVSGKSKPKVNWYQKGRKDALLYWRNMETGENPDSMEGDHIYGYLACLAAEARNEQDSKDKEDIDPHSEYVNGFSDASQERIESLWKRAAIFDGIVAAVKLGSGREKSRGAQS